MTDDNYRDPKVTQDHKTGGSGGGIGKWLGIAAAVIVLLLLLAWLFGLFDDNATVGTVDPDAVIVTPETDGDAVVVTD